MMKHRNYEYIRSPIIDSKKKEYLWDGIAVKDTVTKGVGVFLTKDSRKRLRFPYGGVEIDEVAYKNILKNSGRGRSDYMANGLYDRDGKTITWLDANPIGLKGTDIMYPWIGSLVNEPTDGTTESPNCRLVLADDSDIIPDYPMFNRKTMIFVELCRAVKKDEELLIDYGYDSRTRKHLDYTAACSSSDKKNASESSLAASCKKKVRVTETVIEGYQSHVAKRKHVSGHMAFMRFCKAKKGSM